MGQGFATSDAITIFAIDGTPVARLEVRPDPIWRDQHRGLSSVAPGNRDRFRIITADSLGVPRLLVFEIVKEQR